MATIERIRRSRRRSGNWGECLFISLGKEADVGSNGSPQAKNGQSPSIATRERTAGKERGRRHRPNLPPLSPSGGCEIVYSANFLLFYSSPVSTSARRRTKQQITKPPRTAKTKRTRNAEKNNAARGYQKQHSARPKFTDARNRHGGRKRPNPTPTRCAKRRRNKSDTAARPRPNAKGRRKAQTNETYERNYFRATNPNEPQKNKPKATANPKPLLEAPGNIY